MIKIHTQLFQGKRWLERYRGVQPVFACVFGFTATGLVPGISTAGVTPEDRFYTAIKDAEFLYNSLSQYQCPLPFFKPTSSPALISSAILERQKIPTYLFNAGLPLVPRIPLIDLGGKPAKCVSQGCALEITFLSYATSMGCSIRCQCLNKTTTKKTVRLNKNNNINNNSSNISSSNNNLCLSK